MCVVGAGFWCWSWRLLNYGSKYEISIGGLFLEYCPLCYHMDGNTKYTIRADISTIILFRFSLSLYFLGVGHWFMGLVLVLEFITRGGRFSNPICVHSPEQGLNGCFWGSPPLQLDQCCVWLDQQHLHSNIAWRNLVILGLSTASGYFDSAFFSICFTILKYPSAVQPDVQPVFGVQTWYRLPQNSKQIV